MAAILVVDDDQFSRQFLVALLRAHHHEVVEASDGLEALEVLRQRRTARPIELIIADVLMPTLDGYELVGQFVADEHLETGNERSFPPRRGRRAHFFLPRVVVEDFHNEFPQPTPTTGDHVP